MNHRSPFERLAETVAADADVPLDITIKAVQAEWKGLSVRTVVAESPRLMETSTPMMTLDAGAVRHNVAEMAGWCARHTVELAPHGKTTMAPALWLAQLEAGSWGITVANEAQLRVAHEVGVPRVQLANMLIRPEGVRWLARTLDADDDFSVYTWVDSVEAVAAMHEALARSSHRRPLTVLVEIGASGARTGARDHATALEVAAAVIASPHLSLAGVSGYEGVVTHGTEAADIAAVDDFLLRMRALHDELLSRYEVADAVLTAGGSAYFDRVVEMLGDRVSDSVALVVRSGAYVVHDDGIYTRLTPAETRTGPRFRSAMNVWARVLSIPDPTIAYLDAGRRDLPVDEGWPVVLDARRRVGDAVLTIATDHHDVTGINDQHLHVALPADSPLRVGDVVRLGLSHPCTAFDKWSRIAILDDSSAADPRITDLIRTYF